MKIKLFISFYYLTVLFSLGTVLVSHKNAESYSHEFYSKKHDLNIYPKVIKNKKSRMIITIGDLHGNAQKLLYFLIRNGIVSISKSDYKKFIKIYKTSPDDLTAYDIAQFQKIIDNAIVLPKHKLKFLGDDLCDRGMNDYYTLSIFKKLDESDVIFDIVLSNHGNFFLKTYEGSQNFTENPYGNTRHDRLVQSMLNLGKIIERGLVDKSAILQIIQNNYLTHIVLPGIVSDYKNNTITIYSHAPIDIHLLSYLAEDIEVEFKNSTFLELSSSITHINERISQWILSNTFTEHYNDLLQKHLALQEKSPLKEILWNRNHAILDRQYELEGKDYKIVYVHGHDSAENVFNLDNTFGKGNQNDIGPYAIHILTPN